MTSNEQGSFARRRLHRAALYLDLVRDPLDDGLTYRQRLRRQWPPNWLDLLWFAVVISLSDQVRWYVTVLVAIGLGALFLVLAAAWQNRRERRRVPANASVATPQQPDSDR